MRLDRTWTISFDDQEFDRLAAEIKYLEFPQDLGWHSILAQVATSRQTTLPMRAIERLVMELDMVRVRLSRRSSRQEFQRRFPTIHALCEEVGTIVFIGGKRNAESGRRNINH